MMCVSLSGFGYQNMMITGGTDLSSVSMPPLGTFGRYDFDCIHGCWSACGKGKLNYMTAKTARNAAVKKMNPILSPLASCTMAVAALSCNSSWANLCKEILEAARVKFSREICFQSKDKDISLAKALLYVAVEDEALLAFNREIDAHSVHNERREMPSQSNVQSWNCVEALPIAGKNMNEWLTELDTISREVEAELVSRDIGCDFVEVLDAVNKVLFELRGFKRSPVLVDSKCLYLHTVLSSGCASAILLSVIYIEVCRRLNLTIVGSRVGEDFLIWPPTRNPEELFRTTSGHSLFGIVNGKCVDDPRSKASEINSNSLLVLDIATNRDIIGISLANLIRLYWKRASKMNYGLMLTSPLRPFHKSEDKFNNDRGSNVPLLRPQELRLAIMASERLLILQPHNWALRRDFGMMLYYNREYEEAVQELSICMAFAPEEEAEILERFVEKLNLMQLETSWKSLGQKGARAKTNDLSGNGEDIVCEIRGGRRVELVPDYAKDEFIVPRLWWPWCGEKSKSSVTPADIWMKCSDLVASLMLPEGFPESVTSDYLEYSLWRGVQGIAAQVSGVLATQALLFAVGLGKGAIPTAAAVNWVLKDGIGYVSKIFLSKYGRHFDVNPKGWRLFADLLENAAFGLEILTPAFPHLFVPIGAAAGAGRSAAALIQASTRSCFYAGFAAQRNFAEVIAKGEAQGMVSKSIGILLGIALANCVQSSTSLSLASFGVITWIHMFCNLKSYQSIQLRTLNPYRASLVFSQYLLSGLIPSVKEVNDEEPLFPAFPDLNMKPASEEHDEVLSTDANDAAFHIDRRLQLGSKLSDVVKSKEDAIALFDLYKDEGYILTELEGRYCVVLKESSSAQDMLRSMFQVSYLYWLERNAGIKPNTTIHDCRLGGRLQISLEYVQNEFNHVKNDSEVAGWIVDGLIARPLPNRVRIGSEPASLPAKR